MKNGTKYAIVALLAVATAATFALRGGKREKDAGAFVPPAAVAQVAPDAPPARGAVPEPSAPAESAVATAATPRLVEFGSNRCMACQQMAVVLDALRASQGPKLRVEFLDVMENPELGEPFKISLIPTQILFDAAGKEIYRHTGFFSHDDILAKFRELGVQL